MNVFILIIIILPHLGICAAHTKDSNMDKYAVISKAEGREVTKDNFDECFKALNMEKEKGDMDNLGYAYRVLGDNMSAIGALELAASSYAEAYTLDGEADHDFMIFLKSRLEVSKPYDIKNILKALQKVNARNVKMVAEKLSPFSIEGKATEYKA